jgi:hypothetical protein
MVRYCNKALSMILLLYNLFYMFFTYGLHPNFVFTKYGRDTKELAEFYSTLTPNAMVNVIKIVLNMCSCPYIIARV